MVEARTLVCLFVTCKVCVYVLETSVVLDSGERESVCVCVCLL